MGDNRAPVRAMLSYAERDDALSKRYLQPTDKGPLIGANDMPNLALYVMKANIPDKRYVGALSPQVRDSKYSSWCI